jgi:hypothetical protein
LKKKNSRNNCTFHNFLKFEVLEAPCRVIWLWL